MSQLRGIAYWLPSQALTTVAQAEVWSSSKARPRSVPRELAARYNPFGVATSNFSNDTTTMQVLAGLKKVGAWLAPPPTAAADGRDQWPSRASFLLAAMGGCAGWLYLETS